RRGAGRRFFIDFVPTSRRAPRRCTEVSSAPSLARHYGICSAPSTGDLGRSVCSHCIGPENLDRHHSGLLLFGFDLADVASPSASRISRWLVSLWDVGHIDGRDPAGWLFS